MKTLCPTAAKCRASATVQIKPNSENRIFGFCTWHWLLRLGWSFPAVHVSPPGKGRWVSILTRASLETQAACCMFLRPLHQLNQKPPAGSCWSDGRSHNPQLAQHQVRRLLWKPIQTEPDMFSPGGPDVQMSFSAWLLPTHPCWWAKAGGWFSNLPTGRQAASLSRNSRVRVTLGIRKGETPSWPPSLSLLDKKKEKNTL